MIGRRSVWSDERVIELAKHFVPATDEVWRLQHQKEPDCLFFQEMANQGHYRPTKSTQQGIYVCAPNGKFLASLNSNNPNLVLVKMNEGLSAYKSLAKADRLMENSDSIGKSKRMETRMPKDGLILAMFARDLPENCRPESPCEQKWNRDTVWMSKREAASIIPNNPSPSQEFELPKKLVNRIVALHMVDTVNGQTDAFKVSEIQDAEIVGKITDVNDDWVRFDLSGQTKTESNSTENNRSERGVSTKLLGKAEFDRKSQAFTKFEFVAVGERWGFTRFNDRRRDSRESHPIGFVFQMADKHEPPSVPASIWSYNAPWLNGR